MRRFTFGPPLSSRGRERMGLRGWSGKPFHPPLTDVPITAYILAAAFDLISFIGKSKPWSHDFFRAATFVFIGGALVSLATALTGYLDWRTTEKGTQVRRTVNSHAWTMITVTVIVLVDIAIRWFSKGHAHTPPVVLVLSLVAAVLIFLGASLGGSLVYDYGFNVVNSTDHPVWHPSETDIYAGGS